MKYSMSSLPQPLLVRSAFRNLQKDHVCSFISIESRAFLNAQKNKEITRKERSHKQELKGHKPEQQMIREAVTGNQSWPVRLIVEEM